MPLLDQATGTLASRASGVLVLPRRGELRYFPSC